MKHDTPPVSDMANRRRVLSEATARAALASVAVAILLLSLKGYAAWQTSSIALLGSLADSGLDLLASLVTLYGVRLAATPADSDHRFGHGKAEALAALFQVALITASALAIGWRALAQFQTPTAPISEAGLGIGVSGIAIVATLALVGYQRRIIAQTGSVAVKADSVHYQGDILLNLSVIAALVLDRYLGLRGADPAFGIAIALWLAWGAFKASSHAIDQLMDKEWPQAERERFLNLAARHPELRGIHDFRTRRSGAHDFAQFHMYVAPGMTVAQAHDVMDGVEANIRREFPKVEVLIHVDPEGHVDTDNPLVEEDVTPHWFQKRA